MAAGLAVAAGLGIVFVVVVVLTSGVEPQAPRKTAAAAQTVSRTLLLNIVVFMLFFLCRIFRPLGYVTRFFPDRPTTRKPVPASHPTFAAFEAILSVKRSRFTHEQQFCRPFRPVSILNRSTNEYHCARLERTATQNLQRVPVLF